MDKPKYDPKKNLKIIAILGGGFVLLCALLVAAGIYLYRAAGSTINSDSVNTIDGGFGLVNPGVAVDEGSVKDSSGERDVTASGSGEISDQKVIKTASISMSVNDLDSTVTSVKGILTGVKGYVQSLSDTGTYNDRVLYVTVRIPASRFDEVLTQFKALAVEVTSTSEGSDDITEAYKDLEARLKNQRALEAQYITLLNRATKVSDILLIQKELGTVREQIELYETQIKYYDSQSDMATISLTLSKASESIDVIGEEWKPFGIVKEAFSALVVVLKGLGTLVIWILVLSPMVLVPFGIYKLVKWVKKSRK